MVRKTNWKQVTKGVSGSQDHLSPNKERIIKSLMPRGPRELGLTGKVDNQGGPGEPPPGFVGGTTSKTEWYVYWALERLIGPEGYGWTYQSSYAGGRHVPGGAVVDFVIYMPRQTILCRVQTWKFHFASGPEKVESDIEQKLGLTTVWGDYIVVDVYEQYFIDDETGKAVMEVMKDCMEGLEWPNPMSTGIAGDW